MKKIWDIVVVVVVVVAAVALVAAQDVLVALVAAQDVLSAVAAMVEETEEVGFTISIRIITTAVGRTSRRITGDKLLPTTAVKLHQRPRLAVERGGTLGIDHRLAKRFNKEEARCAKYSASFLFYGCIMRLYCVSHLLVVPCRSAALA
jgi:hypothetical protein